MKEKLIGIVNYNIEKYHVKSRTLSFDFIKN